MHVDDDGVLIMFSQCSLVRYVGLLSFFVFVSSFFFPLFRVFLLPSFFFLLLHSSFSSYRITYSSQLLPYFSVFGFRFSVFGFRFSAIPMYTPIFTYKYTQFILIYLSVFHMQFYTRR